MKKLKIIQLEKLELYEPCLKVSCDAKNGMMVDLLIPERAVVYFKDSDGLKRAEPAANLSPDDILNAHGSFDLGSFGWKDSQMELHEIKTIGDSEITTEIVESPNFVKGLEVRWNLNRQLYWVNFDKLGCFWVELEKLKVGDRIFNL